MGFGDMPQAEYINNLPVCELESVSNSSYKHTDAQILKRVTYTAADGWKRRWWYDDQVFTQRSECPQIKRQHTLFVHPERILPPAASPTASPWAGVCVRKWFRWKGRGNTYWQGSRLHNMALSPLQQQSVSIYQRLINRLPPTPRRSAGEWEEEESSRGGGGGVRHERRKWSISVHLCCNNIKHLHSCCDAPPVSLLVCCCCCFFR